MHKKAEMGFVAVIGGIAVAVVIVVFIGLLAGNVYQSVESDISGIGDNAILSETFTASNTTASELAHGLIQTDSISMSNGTKVVRAADFTIDEDAGTFLLVNDTFNTHTITINYTWGIKEIRDNVQESAVNGFDAWENTTKYLPLIVLAIVIGIILSVVLGLAVFDKGGNNGAL